MLSHDDSLKAAHLELSPIDWEFRQLALENPEYRRRANFPLFAKPSKVFAYRLQPWPTFIAASKIAEMKELSVGVSQLVRSVLERVFNNDPEQIREFYRIHDLAIARLLMTEPLGIDQAISRGDFIMTTSGYKCIEFNLVANLGGWETSLMSDMHMKTPLTAKFIKERQLEMDYADTLDILFKHILRDSRRLFTDQSQPLNVVLTIDSDEPLNDMGAFARTFSAAYRKACEETGNATGLLFPCFPEQLTLEKDDHLKLGRHTIHMVIALYKASSPIVPALFHSATAHKVKLYNSPICSFLGDKRNLAMFSMMAQTDLVNADERRLIDKVVPWTRTQDVPPVLQHVFSELSVDEVVERREELVLKNATSYGGQGVYIGRFTTPQEWQRLIVEALGSRGWVIQEFLQSAPLLYQNGDNGCSPHNVIWGPFVFGANYGGMILRMQPQADLTPVNLSLTATEGMIFEVD